MLSIGDRRGDHVVYDWDSDRLRTFRSHRRALDHAVTLQNRGHDVVAWTETLHGDDIAQWVGLI